MKGRGPSPVDCSLPPTVQARRAQFPLRGSFTRDRGARVGAREGGTHVRHHEAMEGTYNVAREGASITLGETLKPRVDLRRYVNSELFQRHRKVSQIVTSCYTLHEKRLGRIRPVGRLQCTRWTNCNATLNTRSEKGPLDSRWEVSHLVAK